MLWAKHSRSCLPKAGVEFMGLTTQHARCLGTYTCLWILFYMVGNFKEICPNFYNTNFLNPRHFKGT